jgi:hypothetical protein
MSNYISSFLHVSVFSIFLICAKGECYFFGRGWKLLDTEKILLNIKFIGLCLLCNKLIMHSLKHKECLHKFTGSTNYQEPLPSILALLNNYWYSMMKNYAAAELKTYTAVLACTYLSEYKFMSVKKSHIGCEMTCVWVYKVEAIITLKAGFVGLSLTLLSILRMSICILLIFCVMYFHI